MTLTKFPAALQGKCSYSSAKRQKWKTEVYESGSGRYRSLTNQLYPKWSISVLLQPLTDAESRTLHGFVAARKGGYEPFLWLDPEDNHETGIQLAKVSSGVYQALIKMGDYVEPAEYIENVKVYIGGTLQASNTYSVSNGYVTFSTAPASNAVITADYDYYWKVRFDDDGMDIDHIYNNINRSGRFKLVTAR